MNWALERAEQIMALLERSPSQRCTLAAALQQVADECIEAVDSRRLAIVNWRDREAAALKEQGVESLNRVIQLTDRAVGCVDAEDAIRDKFPKEAKRIREGEKP